MVLVISIGGTFLNLVVLALHPAELQRLLHVLELEISAVGVFSEDLSELSCGSYSELLFYHSLELLVVILANIELLVNLLELLLEFLWRGFFFRVEVFGFLSHGLEICFPH
jgi:hypothetical protein